MLFPSTPYPVIDLHCDLLAFLAREPSHTPYDRSVRCAVPQLREGNVKIQVMAIFTETQPGSSFKGAKQVEAFKALPKRCPEFIHLRTSKDYESSVASNKIGAIAAIENASSFAEEGVPLNLVFEQLDSLLKKCGPLAYVSLTWNTENRFGGGAHCNVGIKPDGLHLLDRLAEKGIPVDLSHASDPLAYDILNHLEKKNYSLPVIASHSNLRSITNELRNLPDELAKEIIHRRGLIGLNCISRFVGKDPDKDFSRHLALMLQWKGMEQASLAADFFHDDDLNPAYRVEGYSSFFPAYSDAGCYPRLLSLYQQELKLNQSETEQIAFKNALNFFERFVWL